MPGIMPLRNQYLQRSKMRPPPSAMMGKEREAALRAAMAKGFPNLPKRGKMVPLREKAAAAMRNKTDFEVARRGATR